MAVAAACLRSPNNLGCRTTKPKGSPRDASILTETATAGSHYVAEVRQATWEAGDSSPRYVAATVLRDSVPEADERFGLVFSTPRRTLGMSRRSDAAAYAARLAERRRHDGPSCAS